MALIGVSILWVKVMAAEDSNLLNRMIACSLDGNRALHWRAFVSAFYPLLLSKLHSEQRTVQTMVAISAVAENISTIFKSLTYEEIVQLCSRSCLESPWDSQVPTSGVHQLIKAQTLPYP